jgi:hypothetical protein
VRACTVRGAWYSVLASLEKFRAGRRTVEAKGSYMDASYLESNGTTRRQALRRGAVIAGAVWVTPVVQALSVSKASADQPSGGSKPDRHIDSGRGNGSSPVGNDLDPGRSGPVNQGGD